MIKKLPKGLNASSCNVKGFLNFILIQGNNGIIPDNALQDVLGEYIQDKFGKYIETI